MASCLAILSMMLIASCLIVAPVAARPDVTNVNLAIDPGVVPGDQNYTICFHVNQGLSTANGIFITFDEDTIVDDGMADECILVSYNGTSAHPEIREIIHNPDPEYEQYDFPDGTTTVKMSAPFAIPFNNDVCVEFTCGVYNDCPCGPHHVWANTDVEKAVVISNDEYTDVVITADVIGGDGEIYSTSGNVAPPEFTDTWDCGIAPCYTIVPATEWNISDVWVDGVSVYDDLIWYLNGSAQYCFTPLTCSHELTAAFEGPSTRISGYKLDYETGLGIPGWTMILSDEGGEIASTETDTEGFYQFIDLEYATYSVTEDLEAGYVNITPLIQGDLVISSDNPVIDEVNFINKKLLGNISGYKLDPEGTGLPGWVMILSNETAEVTDTLTNESGYYCFTGLPVGIYMVTEELQPGYTNITPLSQEDLVIDLEQLDITNVNFINKGIGEISGYKLDDLGNPLAGWDINLYDEIGLIRVYKTGTDGFYKFQNLTFGSYKVNETSQSGWYLIDPTEGFYDIIIDEINPVYNNKNFTNKETYIWGYKLENQTGIGVSDWEMHLFNETSEISIASTDESGFYFFAGMPFGTYAVEEEVKAGWINVTPTSIGDLTLDSTNISIGPINFTNEKRATGRINGWVMSHCNVGSLRVPGIKVCVALTPEELGTEHSWCNVTDEKGIYYIDELPTGVTLYAMATGPGYEQRPISYQINTGHMIVCPDFSTTPQIPPLGEENTVQVNWVISKSPFFFLSFF